LIKDFLLILFFFFKEAEFSEWSDCIGIPCQMGKQQRIRNNNEQIQEQNCFVPCLNKNLSTSISNQGIYSNWTNWSECQSPDCISIRTRHCLQEPCRDDYLIDTRSCRGNLCPSKNKILFTIISYLFFSFIGINDTSTLISSSTLNVIVYSSAGIGALIFLLLAILFVFICCRRREHITTKKGTKFHIRHFLLPF
jgi:hypothetical protein